jgi:tetratricopeptide (TPR) repeat protein
MNVLATGYQMAGKPDLALPLMQETLKLAQTKLGADDIDTLRYMNNLASVYKAGGRLDLAVPLWAETLHLRKSKLGAEHPDTFESMNNLALGYQAARKLELALPLHLETVKLRKIALGDNHPDTLRSMHNLAVGYAAAGKLHLAVPLLEETLKLRKSTLGDHHPDTLVTMSYLAMGYVAEGKDDLALPCLQEAVAGLESRQFLLKDAGVITIKLARGYEGLNQFEKAESLRRKWIAICKGRFGSDSVVYAVELQSLGFNLLHQNRSEHAEGVLRESLAVYEKKQPNAWPTFYTQSLLGYARLEQKQYTDAEPLLLAGYQGLKKRAAQIPPVSKSLLGDAAQRLVALYEAWDRPEQAATWRKIVAAEGTPSMSKQP